MILGRGAQVALRQRPDAPHIKIVAFMEDRVINSLRGRDLAAEDAERCVRYLDERRRAFRLEVYGVDWEDRGLYGLVVSTARAGIENSAAAIAALARARIRLSKP